MVKVDSGFDPAGHRKDPGRTPNDHRIVARASLTVQKVHWNCLRGAFKLILWLVSFGTARLLRLLRPLCRDAIELLEPWEKAEANDPDDGEVPKLLADDPRIDGATSSSVMLSGLLRLDS